MTSTPIDEDEWRALLRAAPSEYTSAPRPFKLKCGRCERTLETVTLASTNRVFPGEKNAAWPTMSGQQPALSRRHNQRVWPLASGDDATARVATVRLSLRCKCGQDYPDVDVQALAGPAYRALAAGSRAVYLGR